MMLPLSSWLSQISQVKIAAGFSGSAMRLSAVLPYHVVMLSLEIERQKTSEASRVLVQRSMRANRPSIRGRYASIRYDWPKSSRWLDNGVQCPLSSARTGTRSSAPERMNTSDSRESKYCGNPLSVLRVIEGSERFQPRPKGPLPAPES